MAVSARSHFRTMIQTVLSAQVVQMQPICSEIRLVELMVEPTLEGARKCLVSKAMRARLG